MKTKILMLVVFLLTVRAADAQIVFERTYGGIDADHGSSAMQTDDNGYIITGYTESFGDSTSSNVYLIKTNENGDTLWTKTFGNTKSDGGSEVFITNDSGYIIIGNTSITGITHDTCSIYIIKTDINGNALWTKTVNSLYNACVAAHQTNDNGFIITGYIRDNYWADSTDVYLVKINENGDTTWTKTYFKKNTNDYGVSVLQTNDNGFMILGETINSYEETEDIVLINTDINGDTLWTRTYGGTDTDYGRSIVETNDNGYIICGSTYSFGSGGYDVYIIKIDSTGNQQWYKTYGGIYNDAGESIYKTNDDGYIITGYSSNNDFSSGADLYLIKIDEAGDTLWTRTYGGSQSDRGNSVRQTSDNGYIICGYTYSFGNGNSDVYLIKTNANGESTGINENTNSNGLQIYPNPNKGTFEIKLQSEFSEDQFIEIVNTVGQLVYENHLNKANLTSLKVDLSNCSKGMYFVKVQNANNHMVKKIVIF